MKKIHTQKTEASQSSNTSVEVTERLETCKQSYRKLNQSLHRHFQVTFHRIIKYKSIMILLGLLQKQAIQISLRNKTDREAERVKFDRE